MKAQFSNPVVDSCCHDTRQVWVGPDVRFSCHIRMRLSPGSDCLSAPAWFSAHYTQRRWALPTLLSGTRNQKWTFNWFSPVLVLDVCFRPHLSIKTMAPSLQTHRGAHLWVCVRKRERESDLWRESLFWSCHSSVPRGAPGVLRQAHINNWDCALNILCTGRDSLHSELSPQDRLFSNPAARSAALCLL